MLYFGCNLFAECIMFLTQCHEFPFPATRGHLPRGATFAPNQRWPLVAGTTVVVRVPEFRGGYWNVSCCNRRLYPKVVHKHEGVLVYERGLRIRRHHGGPKTSTKCRRNKFLALSHVWEGAWTERVEDCL